jgi:hypothetical protein
MDHFTYYNPLIRVVTNLFKHTGLNITFRATNTLFSHLRNKAPQDIQNTTGMYRRKCKTCGYSYIGQTESSLQIRCREHVRYFNTNNPNSAYALHNFLQQT